MLPLITTLRVADKLAGKALDTLGIEPVIIKGELLKRDLGLEQFDYCYIQKILGISPSIYIVSFDSRYRFRYIPYTRLMNLKSSHFTRLSVAHNDEYEFSHLKLSPPFNLSDVTPHINAGSVFCLRDIAGEYFRTTNLETPINESINNYQVFYI